MQERHKGGLMDGNSREEVRFGGMVFNFFKMQFKFKQK